MTATAPFDRSTRDLGNVVGLEHVNLEVPDRDLADRFYVSALGFTRDNVDLGLYGNLWVNLGGQQMHLPTGPVAQRFRGRIGLVVTDPAAVARRVEVLRQRFPAATASQLACSDADADADGLPVTGPWGNRFRLHALAPDDPAGVGLRYLEIDVAPGAAAGAAAFYHRILGTPQPVVTPAGSTGGGGTSVRIGRWQELRFVETTAPLPDYDGHHVAIYLHDFSGPYRRLAERGLITRETDADEYRFTDIVDPDSGEVCAVLEHEVRSLHHPLFGRVLASRNPDQVLGPHHRRGHDTLPGIPISGIG